jgi:3-hydroxyacyl-CoA dehydrogenase
MMNNFHGLSEEEFTELTEKLHKILGEHPGNMTLPLIIMKLVEVIENAPSDKA